MDGHPFPVAYLPPDEFDLEASNPAACLTIPGCIYNPPASLTPIRLPACLPTCLQFAFPPPFPILTTAIVITERYFLESHVKYLLTPIFDRRCW